MAEWKPVIDVDGSYLYWKHQKPTIEITATHNALPSEPLAGWEAITADNCEEIAKNLSCYTRYTYSILWLYVILLRS